jgi:hypothetical protein
MIPARHNGRAAVIFLLFLSAAAGCRSMPLAAAPTSTLPSTITECETHTARVCGTWTLLPGTAMYSASWLNGSRANITAIQLDGRAVVFTRFDTGGPTPKMVARYVAIPDGRTVRNGQVRWSDGGLIFFGTWDASW